MTALEALRCKDSAQVTRYTLDFNRYGRRTGWNEQALARQYYKGLPDRLKDEIARVGKPAGLLDLQTLVATLDRRYWERQSEITRDKKSSSNPSSSSNKPTSSDSRSDNRSNPQSSSNGSKQAPPKNKDQKKPAFSSSSSSAPKTNSISDLLGPDGKLKPEERKRRMDNSLCLRYRGTGHRADSCPHASKSKPKARAATTSATTPAAPTSTVPTSGNAAGSGKV